MDTKDSDVSHMEARVPALSSTADLNERRDLTTEDIYWKLNATVPDFAHLSAEAKVATHAEHAMTVREGFKLYPKAIAWSAVLSLAIVMEGYDTILLNQFFALPEFKKHYGQRTQNGDYELSAAWQSGLASGAPIGSIIGLAINGVVAERYGYRRCMMSALTGIACFIFLTFFAVNVEMLAAGQILCGIPWGVFQTLTTTYAAEVMPVALRAYLTTYINLCWIMGQLIGSGILRIFVSYTSQWAYRAPFAIQWAWIVPLFTAVYNAPESPLWLARHGRFEECKRSLLRLTSVTDVPFNVDETVSMMRHAHELEKVMIKGDSYLACFKGVELRRTEIACMCYIIQILCGSPLFIYSTYFFTQTGLPTNKAFDMSVGQYALGFTATIFAWGLLKIYGRRILYIGGLVVMLTILLIIGAISVPAQTQATSWATASLILAFTFVYDLTIGPVCFSLISEIPSTRLRIKTVAMSRMFYNIMYLISSAFMPKMLNPTAWGWKGKTAFFWAGWCLVSLVWTYFRLPEPKGLTYCELGILFEHKASARKFHRFQVILEESGYFYVTSSEGGRNRSRDFVE